MENQGQNSAVFHAFNISVVENVEKLPFVLLTPVENAIPNTQFLLSLNDVNIIFIGALSGGKITDNSNNDRCVILLRKRKARHLAGFSAVHDYLA